MSSEKNSQRKRSINQMNALIFAAGLGTRLRPLTNNCPKAMVKLNGKPLIAHCIEKLIAHQIKTIVINVHHYAEQIIDFVENSQYQGVEIKISDERNQLLDTGGALLKAAPLFCQNHPILICNVDIITDIDFDQLIKFQLQNNPIATLAVRKRKSNRNLLFDNNMILKGWINIETGDQKSPHSLNGQEQMWAFSGIHIVAPKIFELITETGAFSIIDLYLRLAGNHEILGIEHKNRIWIDVGTPRHLAEAEKILNNN